MKRILTALLGLSLFLALLAPIARVAAQPFDPFEVVCTGSGSGNTVCTDKNQPQGISSNSIWGPNGIFYKAINLVSIVIGLAAVAMILIGSLKYITSGGNPEKAAAARRTIIFSLVGIVTALFAQGILLFVLDKL